MRRSVGEAATFPWDRGKGGLLYIAQANTSVSVTSRFRLENYQVFTTPEKYRYEGLKWVLTSGLSRICRYTAYSLTRTLGPGGVDAFLSQPYDRDDRL